MKSNLADILLVIDLQIDVFKSLWNRENLLKLVNQRIADYRKAGKVILFIQHNDDWLLKDSPDWQLIPELDTRETDFYAEKTHANGFYQTNLQEKLQSLKVQSIEFCGAETPFCVNTTLVFAHGLGYRCQMLRGATSTTNFPQMTAEAAVKFYEDQIWNHRFLEFVDRTDGK